MESKQPVTINYLTSNLNIKIDYDKITVEN